MFLMFLPEGKYNKSVITQEMVQHGLVALGLMFHSGYAISWVITITYKHTLGGRGYH